MQLNKALVCAALPLVSLAGSALAQVGFGAPTSAQRWEVRFRIERFSPEGVLLSDTFNTDAITYNTSASVGRVDITYQGRVGILPNTFGTANLGISRLGGAGSNTTGFRIVFTDQIAKQMTLNQGTVDRGLTGDGNAIGNEPNRGMFAPFRSTLQNWTAAANGSNSNAANGQLFNPATGSPVTAFVGGGRTTSFGDGPGGDPSDDSSPLAVGQGTGGPVGVATINGAGLSGGFASYYKASFVPSQGPQLAMARAVTVAVLGQSARYLFVYNELGRASNGVNANLPDVNFAFYVPAPSSGAAMVALGLLSSRRRRLG